MSGGKAVRCHLPRLRLGVGVALFLFAAIPGALRAQDAGDACADVADPVTRSRCLAAAQAAEAALPAIGIAAAGGNPVTGTASTLGMRIGSLPRVAVGGRITAARVEIPEILGDPAAAENLMPVSFDADVTVGLFSGLTPAPTIGGVGSIDLLGSLGLVHLQESRGFQDGVSVAFGLGARLGILRESFTVPGISVSGMYRHVGESTYGDTALSAPDVAFFRSDVSSWSARAAISKRLLFLGVSAGVGYDRYSGDLHLGASGDTLLGPQALTPQQDWSDSRRSAFVNLSWSLLVLHVAGEVGWQSGGDAIEGAPASDASADAGSIFGSIALRLSI